MTAEIITALRAAFGIYRKYGVKIPSASITSTPVTKLLNKNVQSLEEESYSLV